MSQGTMNFEARNRGRKLSPEDLESKLDLRRGSRTERYGKDRNKTRRERNNAAKRDWADA